jgi:integrase
MRLRAVGNALISRQPSALLPSKAAFSLNRNQIIALAAASSLRADMIFGKDRVRFLARNSILPRIRFHDLRHAHATHLLSSGVHPKVASGRLGHSEVGITLDLYSHVLPNMQADAAALVDDALRAVLNKRQSKG